MSVSKNKCCLTTSQSDHVFYSARREQLIEQRKDWRVTGTSIEVHRVKRGVDGDGNV